MKVHKEWISGHAHKLPENPPEQRDEVECSRSRIADSIELFEQNFDETGRPITRKGQKLFKKYNYYYVYTTEKIHHFIINSIRKWIKDHTKKRRCYACLEIIEKEKVSMNVEDTYTVHFHKTCSQKAFKLVFAKSNRK